MLWNPWNDDAGRGRCAVWTGRAGGMPGGGYRAVVRGRRGGIHVPHGLAVLLIAGCSLLHAEEPRERAALRPIGALAEADDVAAVPARVVVPDGADEHAYILIGGTTKKSPIDGYRLVFVLPGGDGGPDFHAFIKRIHHHALSEAWLVVQLVSPYWRAARTEGVVWPTQRAAAEDYLKQQQIEHYVAAVLADIRRTFRIDERYVFTLSWSSGGPAAYALALNDDSPITGSLVVMSVFKPEQLPALTAASGRAFCLMHSPEDRVCPFRMAQEAERLLNANGAATRLVTYAGGHRWPSGLYEQLAEGFAWLVEQASRPGR